MFLVAIVLLILGYGLTYTGVVNSKNGGAGPSLWEAMGFTGENPSTAALPPVPPTPQNTQQGPTFQEL